MKTRTNETIQFTELPAQAKSPPSVLPEHMPVTVQHSSSLRLRMWSESDLKSALPGEKRGFEISFREQQNMFRLTMASDVRLVVAVGVGLDQEHEVNEKLSRNSNKKSPAVHTEQYPLRTQHSAGDRPAVVSEFSCSSEYSSHTMSGSPVLPVHLHVANSHETGR